MDWLLRMNGAVGYIENNLTEDIDIRQAAKIACCSVYHFQRMFSFITDVTLSEYIRRRRLTLAAFELQNGNCKVIDLALKYGYDSPDSFTRAFQNLHGATPTLARDKGVQLKAYPRMSFHISIKGDVEMNYRIVKKEEFIVAGIKIRVPTANGENLKRIPQFWGQCNQDGTSEKICSLSKDAGGNQPGASMLGICSDIGVPGEFEYWIAVETVPGIKASGFETMDIPAATWAVFESVGPMPDAIQSLWKRIYTEFFPESGYERADLPDFELYLPGDINSREYRSEIWIPVLKK